MLLAWDSFQAVHSLAALAACVAWVLAFVLVLLLALWIDARWGEPRAAWHPVVAMGYYLEVCGRVISSLPPAPALVSGALAWWLGVGVVGALAWGLQALAFAQVARLVAAPGPETALALLLVLLLMGWLLKTLLSWRMLHDEVGAVEAALQQSLAAGRERLSWLVSRDTALLSDSEVRESAIESLAENLNDSVVAPIFWWVLFGLPGAAIYRFANTADAMWGYRGMHRGQHWEWAGKWAARADDVLSWLPARLTAWLLAGVARGLPPGALRREAAKTPSPNSGWPMAAMALALGVSLRKPGIYTLNAAGRPPRPADTALARRYASKAVVALVLFAETAILLIAMGLAWTLTP
ncbi:MAG: adenosylcobinamide-phosphate synthase CbiB [Polaromonas sp.]|uniref:adenosylcobinamide-phosphate synthase CbiB n=1 Tax=Polaromonas sp. TaxID=1869339 RepID=UPI002488EE2F|nr:adenosylcobinamide-phosphate synthase CbiB [Polaromonas sp.]MDI1237545.1 adenosylcobinamide-phosphate synthase CbiB [Polaromonas sp.]